MFNELSVNDIADLLKVLAVGGFWSILLMVLCLPQGCELTLWLKSGKRISFKIETPPSSKKKMQYRRAK